MVRTALIIVLTLVLGNGLVLAGVAVLLAPLTGRTTLGIRRFALKAINQVNKKLEAAGPRTLILRCLQFVHATSARCCRIIGFVGVDSILQRRAGRGCGRVGRGEDGRLVKGSSALYVYPKEVGAKRIP